MNLTKYVSVLSIAGLIFQSSYSLAQDYVSLPSPYETSTVYGGKKELSGALVIKEISRKSKGTNYRIYFQNPTVLNRLEVTALKSRLLIYRATLYSLKNEAHEIRDLSNAYVQDSRLSSGSLQTVGPVKFMDILAESYGEEADLLVQVFSFSGTVGLTQEPPLDLSKYKEFSRADWRRVAQNSKGRHLTFADLNDTKWSCSTYDVVWEKFSPAYKIRQYFSPNGKNIQSSSDRNSEPSMWIFTENGWTLPLPSWDIGGISISEAYILRKASQDSIIAEQVVSAESLAKAVISSDIPKHTEASVFSTGNNLRVVAYEYCKKVNF